MLKPKSTTTRKGQDAIIHRRNKRLSQFKTDFEKQVMPTINEENAPYILGSCLSKEPADVVKSIDDDLDTMWKRLDEKYGDPAKVVDVILNAIQNTRNLKDDENKKFVEFINIVEDGYRDKEIRIRKGNNHDSFSERD